MRGGGVILSGIKNNLLPQPSLTLNSKSDKMKITDLLCNCAKTKTLKYILSNPKDPYSKSDIARATKLTWGSIYSNITPEIKKHLLIKTDEYGRGVYYKTNTKSKAYKALTVEVE